MDHLADHPTDGAATAPAHAGGSHVAAGGLRRGVFGLGAGVVLGLLARLVLPSRGGPTDGRGGRA